MHDFSYNKTAKVVHLAFVDLYIIFSLELYFQKSFYIVKLFKDYLIN